MTENPAARLKARMRRDLAEAMKARHAEEVAVLRSVLAALDNAEAPDPGSFTGQTGEVERLALAQADVQAVLRREIRGHEQAAAELAGLGQDERAGLLLRQAAIARRYAV
jgi:uncharacterized protein YqeY